jgi:hypothetical protein
MTHKLSRGQRNIHWIESYCRVPAGPQSGEEVVLSQTQRTVILKLYDGGGEVEPVTGHLAAYVALLHVCGPEAVARGLPLVEVDTFTTWAATGEKLRDVLRREGDVIRCPELGTSYPPARAA